ncbi:hypothetical protein P278_06100 [Zhouia amylolytica AD3]|uniref:Uncharacterized protein n=1 Tax=Zhouia amylolytica AD3 TaxID=1286632 RepID=W2USS4_9FLAO|nr:hypothetical protein P278_06100 [Zhouia amylolytica AD3]
MGIFIRFSCDIKILKNTVLKEKESVYFSGDDTPSITG